MQRDRRSGGRFLHVENSNPLEPRDEVKVVLVEMSNPTIDLRYVQQQIQIARLKLGSALDLLEMLNVAGNDEMDVVHSCALDIQTDIDRLLDRIRVMVKDVSDLH